jgi:hypothetical protein
VKTEQIIGYRTEQWADFIKISGRSNQAGTLIEGSTYYLPECEVRNKEHYNMTPAAVRKLRKALQKREDEYVMMGLLKPEVLG